MEIYNEPDMENEAKDPWSENERIEYLIKKYGQDGLRLEKNRERLYFVIETKEEIKYFHDWKNIPIESAEMEDLIREHLGLERLQKTAEKQEDRAA